MTQDKNIGNNHMDISDDKRIKDFFMLRDLGESTKRTYLIRLTKYSKFTGLTPTELIEEAKTDQIENPWIKERRITKHLVSYKNHLQEKGSSFNTIKTDMATVKGFYHEHDIDTPRIRIKNREKKQRITTDDIVGKKHIKEALKHSNIKYRAIILLMSSSGMGSAEMIHLNWQHFLNAISDYIHLVGKEQFDIPYITEKLRENRNLILTWDIHRYKTSHPYTTFSTPEANLAILDYLNQRNAENKPINNLEDPLFLSGNTRISRWSTQKYFVYLNDTCQFGKSGKNRFFTSHKLRKYFASTLNSNRVPEMFTKWLLGHNANQTVDRYVKPNITALKEEYTRLIPQLSIERVEVKEITTKEYDQLLKELRKKEKEQKRMDEKMDKLEAMIQGLLKKELEEN